MRTLRRIGAVAATGAMAGALLVIPMASPASAAGTFDYTGAYTFTANAARLGLAGQVIDFGAPTDPPECSDGRNNDVNIQPSDWPPNYQDTNPDFPADAQCGSAADNSEVEAGVQAKDTLRLSGNVQSTGAINSPTLNFPVLRTYIQGTVTGQVTITLTGTISSASIDPATGQTQVTATLNASIAVPTLGTCSIGPISAQLTSYPATGVNDGPIPVSLSNYDAATGLVTVANNRYTIPNATGGLFGLCASQFGPGFGLPSPTGKNFLELTLKAQPNPNTQPTTSPITPPSGVVEGDVVTLNGTGADTDRVPCLSPCTLPPPPPNLYRWTQTAGPTVTFIGDANTANPKIRIPEQGTYTFLMQVQDGGPSTTFAPSTQTVTFNAAPSNPTAIPQAKTATNGRLASAVAATSGSQVFLVGSSTDPAPGDPDSSRTYQWSLTGGTCGFPPVVVPSGKNFTWTVPAAASPCTAVWSLQVTDDDGNSGSATLTVSVFPAPAAGTISGVVRSCTNIGVCSPLSGASVLIYTASPFGFVTQTTTGPTGAFSVSGLTNGTPYKVKYEASGHQNIWLGGVFTAGATSDSVVPPNATANADLFQNGVGTGTVTGTVTYPQGQNVPNGTPVRLYNSRGFIKGTTTTAGSYTFTNVPAGNDYLLRFGATSAQVSWSGGQLTQGLAKKFAVTAGGTTTENGVMGIGINPTTPNILTVNSCGCSTTTVTIPSGLPTSSVVGMRIRFVTGAASLRGTDALITARSGNTLTVTPTLGASPANGNTVQIYQPLVAELAKISTATTNTVTVTGKTYATNQFVGYTVKVKNGPGFGQVRTVTANTGTQLTVSPNWTTIPDDPTFDGEIELIPPASADQHTVWGALEGGLTRADTGAAVPAFSSGVGYEVRLYTNAGAFVGRTTVGASESIKRNWSFEDWVADPARPNVRGVPAGTYRILFRAVGGLNQGGTPYCSTWFGGAEGGPSSGAWQYAKPLQVTAGEITKADQYVFYRSTCNVLS